MPKNFLSYQFLKDTFSYTTAIAIYQSTTVVQTLLVRYFIKPEVLGVWNYANLISQLCQNFTLGLDVVSQWELPKLKAKLNSQTYKQLQTSILVTNLIWISLVIGAISIYFKVNDKLSDRNVFISLIIGLIISGLKIGLDNIVVFLKADESFQSLSYSLICAKVISLTVTVFLVYFYNFWGLVIGGISGLVIELLFTFFAWKKNLLNIIEKGYALLTYKLLKLGLRFKIADFPLGLIKNLDMIFISYYSDFANLAIYATAKNIYNAVLKLMISAKSANEVRIFRFLGEGVDFKNMSIYIYLSMILEVIFIAPLLVIFTHTALYVIFELYLTTYLSGINLFAQLALCYYFNSSMTQLRSYLIHERKFVKLVLINYSTLIFGISIYLLRGSSENLELVDVSQTQVVICCLHWVLVLLFGGLAYNIKNLAILFVSFIWSFSFYFSFLWSNFNVGAKFLIILSYIPLSYYLFRLIIAVSGRNLSLSTEL